MKKILLLIPALNAGGAERVMVTLANEWSKYYDVTIMVFNDGSSFYKLSQKVCIKAMNIMPARAGIIRLLSILKTELFRYRVIMKEIKDNDYWFIRSFCFTSNFFSSIVASGNKSKNIIVSERGDPNKCDVFRKTAIDILYRKPFMVICQNQYVRDYFKTKEFKNKLIVLPNPVCFDDIPKIHPNEKKKEIVTVGRLTKQKNHRLLIEAFDEIKDDYPEYIVKIYGEGPLKNELLKMIEKCNLKDRVFLMGNKKRVMFELNNSAFFVLTSDFEGFPNALIEAMASGLPVISSDFATGVAHALITSDDIGYVFDVGDKNGLVESLKKMISREEDFINIGNKNRLVAEKYRQDIVAKQWIESIRIHMYDKNDLGRE